MSGKKSALSFFRLFRVEKWQNVFSCIVLTFLIFSICSFLLTIPSIKSVTEMGVTFVFIGRMCVSLAFATMFIYFSEYYPTAIRTTALG